ncbi:MAG TPA: histidine--tRNA ligase [Gemmatimonadota bacterium]
MESLKGTRDFFPPEMRVRRWLESRWREVAEGYGYEEVDGPVLEPLELYTRKSGDEIVRQLYRLRDAGGREVALRPEMTPTLARMLASRAASLPRPQRWYSVPRLFRYERPQRGRLREFFQLNLDVFGVADESADAELVCATADALRAAGLEDAEFRVRASDRRLVDALLEAEGVESTRRPAVLAAVDRLDRAPEDARAALDRAGWRAADAERVLALFGRPVHEAVAAARDPAVARAAEPLGRLADLVDAGGAGGVLEPTLRVVRGLAYYTGIVFEAHPTAAGFRALCGGGRYDALLEDLGGPALPAAGFGMGDAVLHELLRELGRLREPARRLDLAVIPATAGDLSDAVALARGARAAGLAVETGLRGGGVGKQLARAAANGARLAVVTGEEERRTGRLRLRDLASGAEREVPAADLARAAGGILRGPETGG